MTMWNDPDVRGTLLVVASAVAFSTAGLFTRLIALDTWTILFWRGLFAGLFIAAYVAWTQGSRSFAALRAIGPAGLLAAACSTLASVCFIEALRLASVAEVMVIGATTPFVAAGLTWMCTGRRERPATLVVSAVAVIGVAAMFGGESSSGQVTGGLLALAMTALLSAMMVIIRARSGTSMLPASCLSAFACSVVALPVMAPGWPAAADLVLLFLFGTIQFGLGLLLMTIGARSISATRSALAGTLDVPLAPVWVWLAMGDTPPLMTCVGGTIVMVAVVAEVAWRPTKIRDGG